VINWPRFILPAATWGAFLAISTASYWQRDNSFARADRIEPPPTSVKRPIDDSPYQNAVQAAADTYGIPKALIASVIACESNWAPNAHSRKGARGLMQIMPKTSTGTFGVSPQDLWEPWLNIHVGTAYLRVLSKRFRGDARATLAAYNSGPSRVVRKSKLPSETEKYLHCVERRYSSFSRHFVTQGN